VVIDGNGVVVLAGLDPQCHGAAGGDYFQQRAVDLLFDAQNQRQADAPCEGTVT